VVLHRHLEGYVPLRILWEYQQRGWTKSQWKSFDEMKEQVTLTRPMNNLQEVLDKFVHHQACFVSLEAVQEITREGSSTAARVPVYAHTQMVLLRCSVA
jgi:adenosine deaminase